MSYRVRCSACGKIMTLEDDAAGESLVCVACGTRLEAPPPPGTELSATPEGGADAIAWDQTEVPPIQDCAVGGVRPLDRERYVTAAAPPTPTVPGGSCSASLAEDWSSSSWRCC